MNNQPNPVKNPEVEPVQSTGSLNVGPAVTSGEIKFHQPVSVEEIRTDLANMGQVVTIEGQTRQLQAAFEPEQK